MKSVFLALIAVLALVFAPAPAAGQAAQTEAAKPPISQPLVREGTLAVALAQALQVVTTTDEATAESMLSSVGIAPKNGWIADYPVTPEVAGDLQNAVVLAAESGKLPMNDTEALSAFQDVADKYGLPLKEGEPGGIGEVAPSPYSDSAELDDYYYDEGPPVVTYYAPPPAYAYLYDWVPYPFWWSDVWFPGYFVLVDFDTTIIVHGHRRHFSNHFFDRSRDRFARITPEHRFHRDAFSGGRGFRDSETHARRDVAGGMNNIMRWRHDFATGNRLSGVSPGESPQVRHPYRRGSFIAHSGGHSVMPGHAAINSLGRTEPRGIGREHVPVRTAPPPRSTMSSGSYGRSFEGRRVAGASPHWEGGHSFGGFRASAGAGSYNRPSGDGRSFGAVPHWEGGGSFGGFRGASRGGFRR